MRKIMIGALSVAGLLATVLALASSPATSQDQKVVRFVTATDPGTYTVSWRTEGGCDPSKPDADTTLATDGATGSISRTVAPGSDADDDSSVGDADAAGSTIEIGVSVADHCEYDWTATFTSNLAASDGIGCLIGVGAETPQRNGAITVPDIEDVDADLTLVVASGETAGVSNCNAVATINVDIQRPRTADVDDVDGDDDKTELIPDQPHSGAILNTTFTVTATPVKDSNDECEAVTEETEVDDSADASADHTVGASLKVLQTPLSDPRASATCEYDVAVAVPDGFKAADKKSDEAKVEDYDPLEITPTQAADDSAGAVDDLDATDCGEERFIDNDDEGDVTDNAVTVSCRTDFADVQLDLVVAERMMYVLQNVVGDSGGANARYSLTLNKVCAIPHDLPANLLAREVGGIQTTDSVTVVELREGFFNISAAVMGRHSTDTDDYGRTFAPRYALNSDGEPCSFTASVSHLPDNCDAAEESITANAVTGADSHGRVITTFDIGCEEAMDEEAMDEEAMDEEAMDEEAMDDEATDDSGDAMEDMEDDEATDDSGDAMEDMEDDDAMGPPPDEPTG